MCKASEDNRADRDDADTTDRWVVEGHAWFGPGCEGPPGHAHGGSQAAVLDEAMGAVAWINSHSCVAGGFQIKYEQMLKLVHHLARLRVDWCALFTSFY